MVDQDSIIYFTRWQMDSIYQLDTRSPSPQPTGLVKVPFDSIGNENSISYDLIIEGDILYVSFFNSDKNGFIGKYDLSLPGSAPTIILENLGEFTTGMTKLNDDIYFTTFPNLTDTSGKVYKFNVNQLTQPPELILSGLSEPYDITSQGNFLYISETNKNKILQVDLNQTPYAKQDFITGLDIPIGIKIKNNQLYVCDFFGSRIIPKDVNSINSIEETVLSNIHLPIDVAFVGNTLFISEYAYIPDSAKLTKMELVSGLFSKDLVEIKCYPNPTTDFVNIRLNNPLSMVTVRILSSDGKFISSSNFIEFKNEMIRLPEHSGTYLIHINSPNGSWVYPILKQ